MFNNDLDGFQAAFFDEMSLIETLPGVGGSGTAVPEPGSIVLRGNRRGAGGGRAATPAIKRLDVGCERHSEPGSLCGMSVMDAISFSNLITRSGR